MNLSKADTEAVKKEVLSWIEKEEQKRSSYQKQWLINKNFRVGNHYLRYNIRTRNLETYRPDNYDVSVNFVKSKHKAMKSALIGDEPIPQAQPDDVTDEALQNTEGVNKWLLKQWQELELLKMNAKVVHDALLESYAALWFEWNPLKKDGMGGFEVTYYDAFDFIAESFPVKNSKYVIMFGKVDLEDLQNAKDIEEGEEVDKYENLDGLVASSGDYRSDYKNQMLNIMRGTGETRRKKIDITECYYQVYGEDNKPEVWVITLAGDDDRVIRHKKTNLWFFPGAALDLDIEPGENCGYAWARDIVNLNQAYNQLARSTLQFHDFMAKFRLLVSTNAKLKIFTNANGQIIKHPPGSSIKPMEMRGQVSSVFQQQQQFERGMEDLSVSDVRFGRIPSGLKSGAAIEEVVAADQGKNTEYFQAMKEFIQDEFEILVNMGAYYINTSQEFQDVSERKKYAVIGENPVAQIGEENPDVVNLKSGTQVMVSIGTALGHTAEARKQNARMLFAEGIVTNPTWVLKQMGITDIDEAMGQEQQAEGMAPEGEFGPAEVKQIAAEIEQLKAAGAPPEQIQQLEQQAQQMADALLQQA